MNIKLKNKTTNEIVEFRSQTLASISLKRGHGYLHYCIKNNRKIYDSENNEYELIEYKKSK